MSALGSIVSARSTRLAILVPALVALLLVPVAIVLLFQAQAEETAEALADLTHQNGEIASLPQARAQLVRLETQWMGDSRWLHAANLSLAQAELQNDLKTIVESNLGTIRSAEPTTTDPTEGLDGVAVQFDLTVPLSRLRDLLAAIEARRPYLFMSDLHVSAPRNTAPGQGDPDLEVRATIEAYRAGRPS